MANKFNRPPPKHRGREGHSKRGETHLTGMRLQFAHEYCIDRNAAAAARRAGFSEQYANSAAKLLRVRAVRDKIDELTRDRMLRVGVAADDVLRELKRIAFFDLRKLVNPATGALRSIAELDEEDARALVGYDVVVTDKATGQFILRVNPGNKLRALELLGKSIALFADRCDANEKRVVRFTLDYGDGEEASVAEQ